MQNYYLHASAIFNKNCFYFPPIPHSQPFIQVTHSRSENYKIKFILALNDSISAKSRRERNEVCDFYDFIKCFGGGKRNVGK